MRTTTRLLSSSLVFAAVTAGAGCSNQLTPEKVREHLDNPTAEANADSLPSAARDFFSAQRASQAESLAYFARGLAGNDTGSGALNGALGSADKAIAAAGVGDVFCAGGFVASAVGFDGCEFGDDCDAELTLDSCLLRAGGDEHANGKIVFKLKSESSDTAGVDYNRSELSLSFEDFEVTDGSEMDYYDGLLALETSEYLDRNEDAEDRVEVILAADLTHQRRTIERGWFDDGAITTERASAGVRFTSTASDDTASVSVELLAFTDEDDNARDQSLVLAFAAEAEEVSPDKTLAEATLSVRGSNGDFTCTWSGAAEERTDESATVTSAGSCTDDNGDTFDFSGTATAR
jgi:hypothetical protein